MKFKLIALVAIVVLEVVLAANLVHSAAIDEAKGLSETLKGKVVKKVVAAAKGEPKIRRTIRLREVPPAAEPAQQPPVASANSTVNNEGSVNSVEVKPEITVSTNPEQKQESPLEEKKKLDEDSSSPSSDSDSGDENESKPKPKKKKKKNSKKGKGKPAVKKGKFEDSSMDESPEDDDDQGEEVRDEKPSKGSEEAKPSQESDPKSPIQVSQEQNLVQQKLNELPVDDESSPAATTAATQTPNSEEAKGDKETVYLADSNNMKQSVLNNVGNTEMVEMNGVGNKKIIKMTDSGNQETEEHGKDKKEAATKCEHKDHSTEVHHHHYYNNNSSASEQPPAVQVNIQAPEPSLPQVAGLAQMAHNPMMIGPQFGGQIVPMVQHPASVLGNTAGQMMVMATNGGHAVQPMLQPMMHHPMMQPVVHAPYGYGPLHHAMSQPPVLHVPVPVPMPYPYPGYPQPPKSRKKPKKKKGKSNKSTTTTTTTTPAPTTTTTTEEPTTTTTTTTTTMPPPTTTTERIEWELVKVPRRKLKNVIQGGAKMIV